MTPEQRAASRVGMRQYARGRAYDPDRFGGVTPYHEDPERKTTVEDSADAEEKPTPVGAAAHSGPVPEKERIHGEEPETLDTQLEELNEELDTAIDGESADENKEN